jgi:hypothetical protein
LPFRVRRAADVHQAAPGDVVPSISPSAAVTSHCWWARAFVRRPRPEPLSSVLSVPFRAHRLLRRAGAKTQSPPRRCQCRGRPPRATVPAAMPPRRRHRSSPNRGPLSLPPSLTSLVADPSHLPAVQSSAGAPPPSLSSSKHRSPEPGPLLHLSLQESVPSHRHTAASRP